MKRFFAGVLKSTDNILGKTKDIGETVVYRQLRVYKID
jgi:hypothetical protein